ncbi:MAG: hypothetical protein ABIS92_01160 [Polyangia bacterium]
MSNSDVMQSPQPQLDLASRTGSATPQPRRLRSVGAVAVGLVGIFAVTTAVDAVMHATGVFPPIGAAPMSDALFLLAFAYRFVIDIAGSWLAARLAPVRPMRHALVLGAIGLVLSIAGAVAMWDASRAWYPIALAVSALPSAWLGGRLVQRAHLGHESRGQKLRG